ncbi:very short patch repair endonuclease [Flavisolibacter ginsengisoli]|jgi:DNA mismatch endonuclease (patch repair protein)|uniref:Very short patch repair endonuclease n=1 Tax=Flavisolibacter ginsengisoli DSM 18119 TaxID=1121884 RepID=A0A1M5CFF2_9BACT|nr:very short patch repair endonuclease [Flavisolibacter ginsengisoli]SHF53494.1 T/G mismatch-specific endonuclease [Flavisolibacter ginsengisoli DSM 18119]
MDMLSPGQRRKTMQAIKSTNTKIEIMLGKALWAQGYRYRKNDKSVFGKPDFTFKKYRLVIFCDSEFWHGKNWETLQKRLRSNREYWIPKIERNIARDIKVNETLIQDGWTVLRFWESEIKNSLSMCISKVESIIKGAAQVDNFIS